MSSIPNGCGSLLEMEEAKELAAKLTTEDSDKWIYKAFPTLSGLWIIEIYDETDAFVGML